MVYFCKHIILNSIIFLILPLLLNSSISFKASLLIYPASIRFSKIFIKNPWISWIIGIGTFYFWQIPLTFNVVMNKPQNGLSLYLHLFGAFSLFVSGLIFWWPLMLNSHSFSLSKKILYLLAACISVILLGLYITFSPIDTYSCNISLSPEFGIPLFIKKDWNFTSIMDRQLAGFITAIMNSILYLIVALSLMRKSKDLA